MRFKDTKSPFTFTLPDGQSGESETGSASQANKVWEIWERLAPLAASRGEGVKILIEEDGYISLSTVYASLWEGVRVMVSPNGETSDCSEQSAPDWGCRALI